MFKNKLTEKQNLIASGIICCITPILCYLMVECANSGWSCLFVEGAGLSLDMHALNLLVYALFTLFILCISASFRIASIVSYAFFLLLGAAQHYVCIFRGMGFVASDFYSASAAREVATGYNFMPDKGMWLAIAIGVVGIVISSLFPGKFASGKKARIALLAGAVATAGVFYGMFFCLPQTRDMKVKLYRPQETYTKNGSMLTFVRSFRYLVIDKPVGYSPEAAQEIANRYKKAEPAKKISAKEKPNLILIMNESLCDVADLSGGKIKTNKDVLPVIHGLKDNTVKATLHEERRGGGTAIMEFETLTGCTNAFFPIGTMAYQTIIKTPTPSLASQLKAAGYGGIIASHPHSPNGYNRVNAYPLLGFNEFISIDDFLNDGFDDRYGKYISDKSAYDEIIAEYEAHKASSNSPFFEFQVTMQNHAPYNKPDTHDIKITSKKYYDAEVEGYLNYAHESDKEIGRLIEYFKKTDDPTLVVVFGDHAPRFDTSYYQKILGATSESDMNEIGFQETPMIMWANYDIKSEDLGDTSDNYTTAKIIDLLGLEKTGFQRYLQDLQETIPMINSLGCWTSTDKECLMENYRASDKNEPLNEYNILIYNNLIDTKHRIKGFFE